LAENRSKKETIQFTLQVAAGADLSGLTSLRQRLKSEGTIQRIFGQFYAGQQGDLQVRPYLVLRNERSEELVTYPSGANRYMSGDNTNFDFSVDFDVLPDFEIRLDVKNLSIYPYTLQISFEVDYVGGTLRVV
jgi:hypothetical protein